ncbi:MAG TPA: bifunctional phosphoribosylaminoimidazolecarboxamide formyltransferase/IMP cyclohydrolase [Trueperaceae bacterium]|nr:bifunctional phosphoribosylaminoimidazolecarboxamide formyltransferase/IMP cyclohydrolase [Trueperaceae bacterium]
MPDQAPRALISVSDKTGVEDLAGGLVELGYQVVSTGNTLRALEAAGVQATAVSDVTGFPEILGGRVKTLHPVIHGGVLAKRTAEHLAEISGHGIAPVDVVVSNLYPFRETVARADVSLEEALEQIDIGGPAMIRAAAKNHPSVVVVVDPSDYAAVLEDLRSGMSADRRRELAVKAFAHTAAYDAAIVTWLQRDEDLPKYLNLALTREQELRYGENPHQRGARYRYVGRSSVWDGMVQHSGQPLSYLNLFDGEAAWRLAHELPGTACVIVKHANACGAAVAEDLRTAYERAFAADPKSAFGGVVALPGIVDLELAERIAANPKADVILARAYDASALELLARKRKNTRLLQLASAGPSGLDLRRADGGLLVQGPDEVENQEAWQVVTRRQPTEAEWLDLQIAYRVCARTTSNAIVLVKDGVAFGVGAGQQSRVDAVEIAAEKAAGRAAGGACASDAFFPFRDGLDAVAAAGVTAVVQPGGSIRDPEIIEAADEMGLAMVVTGHRHFKH